MFKALYKSTKYNKDNERFLNIISYYISKRDFETVIRLITNVNSFTKDSNMAKRVNGLFLQDPRVKEFFGIGEDIVGSMSNMVFGGNVDIKIDQNNLQKELDDLYNDGYYIRSVIEAYKTAIATNGRSYIFFDVEPIYNTNTEEKIKNEFLNFTVEPEFNLEIYENQVIRTFIKEVGTDKDLELYEFKYRYVINDINDVDLFIEGYDEKDNRLPDEKVMIILDIETIYENFDFVPYDILDLNEGMLPNILWIENSLAENLYFQDEDLPNSQTKIYLPEDQLFEDVGGNKYNKDINDKYNLTKIVKGGSIDRRENVALVVKGESAIATIEKNLALNVVQACLDAKISPVSIGYLPTDKLGTNTDVGGDKERVSIRLRESHIDRLKIFMAKILRKFLFLKGYKVKLDKISIIFAQYITPSIESLTNTLAKQVQFGIKSSDLAIKELNRGELTDEEVEREVELIKQFSTQQDFNVNTISNNVKGIDNNLKGEGVEE